MSPNQYREMIQEVLRRPRAGLTPEAADATLRVAIHRGHRCALPVLNLIDALVATTRISSITSAIDETSADAREWRHMHSFTVCPTSGADFTVTVSTTVDGRSILYIETSAVEGGRFSPRTISALLEAIKGEVLS